jgi:hypothetical protein
MDFLHRGPFDPQGLTGGPRIHVRGACWPGQPVQRPCLATTNGATHQRPCRVALRRGNERAEDAGRIGDSPSSLLEARKGRGMPDYVESPAGELGIYDKEDDGAGDCGWPSSIPRTGVKREAWGSSWTTWPGLGRTGTAAERGGHGGGLGHACGRGNRGRREQLERGREKVSERERRRRSLSSSRRSAAACITAGDRAMGGCSTELLAVYRKKIRRFCKKALHFSRFS